MGSGLVRTMQEARQSWFCHLTSPAMGKWSVIHLQPQFFSQVEWITMQGHCEAIIFIFFFFFNIYLAALGLSCGMQDL